MISMKDVCFDYDNGTRALYNVNLNIEDGEFVFVVGQSGAGKSSMLKLLTRENIATAGGVIINNYNLGNLNKKEIPYFRRTVGMVFQDFRLIPGMTVFDNVAFVLRVTNYSNKYISTRVPYVLDLVNLSDSANKFPSELSGGEQQRIAIARALLNSPKVLLADEPTGNLDPETTDQIMGVFSEIAVTGTAVIIATHNMAILDRFPGTVYQCEGQNFSKYEN